MRYIPAVLTARNPGSSINVSTRGMSNLEERLSEGVSGLGEPSINEKQLSQESDDSAKNVDDNHETMENALRMTSPTSAEAGTSVVHDFRASGHFAANVGVAAMECGSTAGKVEKFLATSLKGFGYTGVFYATQAYLFCTFHESPSINDDATTVTRMYVFKNGLCLNKLGLLAELAKKITKKTITRHDAEKRLDAIRKTPDPWGQLFVLFTHISASAGMVIVLNGGWIDVSLGAVAGFLVFCVKVFFARVRIRKQAWINFTAAFVCAVFAALVKMRKTKVNVVIVTLSGVYIQVPGYAMTLGTAELVTNHIVSGVSRMISGILVMLWLFIGGWCGWSLVDSFANFESGMTGTSVPTVWHALFVPLLCLSMIPRFQIAKRDILGSLVCMAVAYGTSYGFTFIDRADLGIFLSAVVMTCVANIWSRLTDRPNTIVLTPAFVLQAGGTIGFRGIIDMIEGDKVVGFDQFLRMFEVALLLVGGIFAGNTLIPAGTTF